jgi:hypothetical protein
MIILERLILSLFFSFSLLKKCFLKSSSYSDHTFSSNDTFLLTVIPMPALLPQGADPPTHRGVHVCICVCVHVYVYFVCWKREEREQED